MTLEDFFTLTEMKDGLTLPSRVEELVTFMKKEKESVVKNVGDATRQWTAVASTIAATESKDCLDLFIQLDGVWFLDKWLKSAQKFDNDSSDSFVEESITALLLALEKLHRTKEMSVSSEIWNTVKTFLGHNSSRVQDGARLLFDNWKRGRVTDNVDSGGSEHEISNTATVTAENNGPQFSAKDGPVSRGSSLEENDATKIGNHPSSLEVVQPENTGDLPVETTYDNREPHLNSDHSDMENRSPSLLASLLSKHVQENLPMKEEHQAKTVEKTASHEVCSLPDSTQENIEVSEAQKLNGLSSDEKLFDMTVSNSSTVEHALVSSDAASALEVTTESNSQNDSEATRSDVLKSVDFTNENTCASEPKKAISDSAAMNHSSSSSQLFQSVGEDSESHLRMLRSSSDYELMYKKHGDLETRFSRISGTGTTGEDKKKCGLEDLRGSSRLSSSSVAINTASDIDLEYGLVDALEIARKVAQEVEREVVDDREPFSWSSDKNSDDIRHLSTPGSINRNQNLPTEVLPMGVSSGPTQSAGAHTEGEELIINSDDAVIESENDLHDMESSRLTVAQDTEPNTDKSLCDFDLNQEVCSDDLEEAANSISIPVSVVSASRVAAVHGLPASPLQFEGTLGWKGSAASSAFRPASPRRNSDSDKTLSIRGTSSSSKQRLDCLDFDLNFAEAGDEKSAELMFGRQVTSSSGLHSAKSLVKASDKKSKRLELDLNCISDDGDGAALDSRVEEHQLFYDRNGHCSQSPASSSSSIQPYLRSFDLNDGPYSHINALKQGPYPGRSSRIAVADGGPKPNDHVISIMGTRVEVNRKDFVSQALSFSNGKAVDLTTDASIMRTAGFMGLTSSASYTHPSAFSSNGLSMSPRMPFSSAIYGASGSIPYIVDSGAPVVPQLMGSTLAVPLAYSQAQFLMSMNNASAGLNGPGPSRPSFDLNSGLAIEGRTTDFMGLRQPFMPGHGRSIEEHLRADTIASSSSGVAGKRKEPDGGWEPYTFNFRQQQFP